MAFNVLWGILQLLQKGVVPDADKCREKYKYPLSVYINIC